MVEVLSLITAGRDRGEKLREYRRLPSVQEYLLIEGQDIFVEIYRCSDRRFWLCDTYGSGNVLRLESLAINLTIDALYDSILNIQNR